ncbi:MAG TPA: TlpA disulfide reductase family protein, partial [Bacteroidales bacterium]|nr:TlpA disulfide reductase family protein [Bacteroidales bacterium]
TVHLPDGDGGLIILEELRVRELLPLDSQPPGPDARASFAPDPASPGFYLLRFSDGGVVSLLLSPGEQTLVTRHGKGGQWTYDVQGSPGSSLLREYFYHRADDEAILDSLGQVFRDSRSLTDFVRIREQLDSQYTLLLEGHRQWVFRFIMDHDTSLAGLFLLNQRFGNGPVFSEEDAFGLMEHLDTLLYARYKGNLHVLDHRRRVSAFRRSRFALDLAMQRLAPGRPAPALSLRDASDQDWRLSSLAGQPILLHFWASGDARSRRDNRELPSLLRTHPQVQPVSVSMDTQREAWLAAVALDGLEWTQVSELLGMESPAAIKYLPEKSLPVYVLIDSRGKIVSRVQDLETLRTALEDLKKRG